MGDRRRSIRICVTTALVLIAASNRAALAQNYSFDARDIALGSVAGVGNLSTKMIEEQRPYRSIVLPFGLFQVFSNTDIYNPDSKAFDPITAIENVSSPLHYIFNRHSGDAAQLAFVNDLRNATLSRDLTKYRGFAPANDLLGAGLEAPNWGATFKLTQDDRGGFHGVYVGAGPYFTLRDESTFDPALTNVWATGVNVPNALLPITNEAEVQLALAITGGYRGRMAWPSGIGSGSDREGLYFAANYNYIRGFQYLFDDLAVRLRTDSAGLVTTTSNIVLDNRTATEGNGFSIDMGVGAVINHWEFGFGAKGIANRINWREVEQQAFVLASVTNGGDFIDSPTFPAADMRVTVPVDVRGNASYVTDRWSAAVGVGHGFGGGFFHGGYERRFNRLEARGGGRYTFGIWNPSGGVGYDFTPRVSIDVALFGTSTNIERTRKAALAVSIRFNHIKGPFA